MLGSNGGELLLMIGLSVMALAAIGAVIAGVLLHTSGKRLKKRLETEYGAKRHK